MLVSNALLSLGVISAAAAGEVEINKAATTPNNPKKIFLLLMDGQHGRELGVYMIIGSKTKYLKIRSYY